MGAFQLSLILKRLFALIASPDTWGKTGVEFITCTSWKISGEATPTAILITDGVGKGNLGMVTTFCHHDQAKIEASDAFSNLHQHDPLDPSMVVVRRYTNTHYIPHGTSCFLYLDMRTLSRGASSTQFPLDWLHLCRLLPFSEIEVILPHEEGQLGFKVYPYSQEVLWESSEEEHHLSDLVLLSISSLALHPHLEEGTQTEGGFGFHQALKCLQDTNQSRAQLECELVQDT